MSKDEQLWLAIEVTVKAAGAEAVEFAFNELDSSGTEINNLGKISSETVAVIGYFDQPQNEETVRDQLNEALRIYGFAPEAIRKIDRRRIENVDWLFDWKKHWKPTETAKFIVAPTWEDLENTEKIIVRIEPGMAFGTGTHETTQLCLKAIEENFSPEMSFLDVGTGTGILSIAAFKMKAEPENENSKSDEQKPAIEINDLIARKQVFSSFSACDTDFDSIGIAAENAFLNDVSEINFYVGSINAETPEFDFVCANLTIDVIVPLLPLLIEKARKVLVLSGILNEQKNSIADELRKNQISDFKIETQGEWISVVITKLQEAENSR